MIDAPHPPPPQGNADASHRADASHSADAPRPARDCGCGAGDVSGALTEEFIRARTHAHQRTVITRADLRSAAVLAPFVCIDGTWHVLLTRRTEDLEHHRGQISFPGGSADPGETPVTTALREAWEEISLPPGEVEIIGLMDDRWTPTGFCITPVLGIVRSLDGLRANPSEVSRIFTVPLAHFADERNAVVRTVRVNGFLRDVYYYDYDGETIWGATAFIIRDILHVLGLSEKKSGIRPNRGAA